MGANNLQLLFKHHLSKKLTNLAICVMAAGLLASCGNTSDVSSVKLIPAVADKVVFYIGTGTGPKIINLNQVYLGPKNPKNLPGGLLAIVANCKGKGSLLVRVLPGGEADDPTCNWPNGGGGWMATLPAKQPWPTKIVIKAAKGTHWSIAVVDPQGSTGVAEPG
ncbi:hypothetical protein [Acidithrix ferrooxidans]|uniref:Uncharacterized protein n=1 Tax=Acidithrix ferrooxidans TaxID=1280514 RepID=A0A0D8HCM0_9ACTN|nr:hypothetical protein [Acidithrix ferrooxidans]KJF15634.1 hypothetical protein AXFE_35060 [Acidithrix ferrooxidans]